MSGLTLIAITGLPASGKSTLARELARRLGAPVLAKDWIKEPLLEVLGPGDRSHSRRLSDASFAVLFGLARQMLAHLASDAPAPRACAQPTVLILEGNFRRGEHEAPFNRLLSQGARLVQIECRVDESVRLERLRRRAGDPARHSGHRDAELVMAHTNAVAGFLALPGKCVGFDSGATAPNFDRLEGELDLTTGAARR
ncbi:MAG TPA: AAA family ATPase [Steroidobacteraceae bacterium]|jgi:predicted kinase